MKKLVALLLCAALILSMAACAAQTQGGTAQPADAPSGQPAADGETPRASVRIGLICDGDENDQGYTYNFIRAKDAATERLAADGIDAQWVVKYNIKENDTCTDACIELAEEDCDMIITISFGHEEFMLKVAPDYPDIEFVNCTNSASSRSELANVHNAFANIYEARYVAGIAGGMKLQQLIDDGAITEKQAVIGYVGAFSYAEVISGFTAFYLGAKSACPSATMKVKYVNEWSNATEEANAAQYGCTPTQFAERMGLLGERCYYAHCVQLTRGDMALLAKTGTGVAHCPNSDMLLNTGACRLPDLFARGAKIGIGVDGATNNNASNMMLELKNAYLIHRAACKDKCLSPEEILQIATVGGAAVLGRTDIGRLAPGMAADLVILDWSQFQYAGGRNDPVAAIVLSGDARMVDTVLVGGQVVVSGGKLTRVDERSAARRIDEAARTLYGRAAALHPQLLG